MAPRTQDRSTYQAVKAASDIDLGVPSQCLLPKNFIPGAAGGGGRGGGRGGRGGGRDAPSTQYLANVAMKVCERAGTVTAWETGGRGMCSSLWGRRGVAQYIWALCVAVVVGSTYVSPVCA